MPAVAAALMAILGMKQTMALLLGAAAIAVGAEIALTGLLEQIRDGNVFQRIYATLNLRLLWVQIFQQQAAKTAATTPTLPYTEVEDYAFKTSNAATPSKDEILVYTEVRYRDDLVYKWQSVVAAYKNNLITYDEMFQWTAWANTQPLKPDQAPYTWAVCDRNIPYFLPEMFPVFTDLAALQAYYDLWVTKYAERLITYDQYSRIYENYLAQHHRIAGYVEPIVPPVVAQPVTDITTIEVRLGEIRDKIAALSLAPPSEIAPRLADIVDEIAALKLSVTVPEGAIKVDVAPADIKVTVDLAELASLLTAATAAAAAAVAQGAKTAADTQSKAITDSGVGVAAAIAALAGLATTFSAEKMKNWGHDTATSARTCWAATAADIVGKIAGAVVPLAVGVAIDKLDPLRNAMNNIMERVFNEILSDPALQKPVTPDEAPAVAAALFRKAFQIGQAAHMLSVLSEVVTPLKMLGIGQAAAFLADMSGFAKIGGAMMGAIESQALARPFGYYLNQRTLTNRPNTGQLGALASDQAITREEYISEMAYQGFVRAWAEELYDTTFRALAPRQLQMMAEAGIADDAYFDRELKHGGLRPETITLVKEMFRLAALGELKPTGQAVAVKRYTEGITGDAELNAELDDLGFRGTKLATAVRLARLSRDTDLLLERITIAVNAYLGDDITTAQLETQLTSLGLEPERVKVIHDRAAQRYRPPKLADRLPRLKEQYVNTLLNNVELGFATAENIYPSLLAGGYTTAEARLAIDNSKEIARQALIKDQITILEDKLTDKEITLDQLRMQLLTLGITTEQVNARVELNRLRIQPTPKTPTTEEIPELTTAQLLAAYKVEILSEAVVRAELLERKYQLADIDVLIRLNTAAAKTPTAATVHLATEAELKAWFAGGLITEKQFYNGLIARGRSDLDARRIIELELIKAEARIK